MELPELVAHRGYAGAFPENTLAAVRAAFELGARHVEIDVQLSAGGTPHLFHDESLKRVCGVAGSIGELDDAAIARLSAAERRRFGERFAGEPVPTLRAFVELLAAQPDARAFVEVKPVAVRAFGVERVLDVVLAELEPVRPRCTLISFSTDLLRAARARGGIALGPILESWKQLRADDTLALAPEVVFCDVRRLPRRGPLDVGEADLAVYEVVEPEKALELGRRGARYVETFEYAAMSAALARTREGR
jgi:glycerophosphoryl diester phosphodiesterase